MRSERVLITGASGEFGHAIINRLNGTATTYVVAFDARPAEELAPKVQEFVVGDVLCGELISKVIEDFLPTTIFHLAALLSTAGEKSPQLAHRVNVDGSFNILEAARAASARIDRPVKVIFPSSIAVYGPNDNGRKAGRVREEQNLSPVTIYGANKLYVEKLGIYYAAHYPVDFRCIRFPGILSAETLPTGGTTDYGPEMLHAAAQGKEYTCFVGERTRLPFMSMQDAVKAVFMIAEAAVGTLSRRVYNVTSFSVSAKDIEKEVLKYFPDAKITYEPHEKRRAIAESWPRDMNDAAARRDWKWKPDLGFHKSFSQYLVPGVRRRYGLMAQEGG